MINTTKIIQLILILTLSCPAFSQLSNSRELSLEGYNLPQSYYYLNSVGELYDFQNEWKTILDFNWEFTEGLSLITNTVINLNTSAKSRRFINIRDA
ncbi:MAG: hypothetical protein EX254_06505, partial [Flavobacteriaceae bacterium]